MSWDSPEKILKLRNGEERAWRALFDDFYPLMYQIAFQYTGDRSAAQSIVMEVLENLWDKRIGIEIKNSLRSYLLGAVRKRSVNYLKSFYIKNMKPMPSETFLGEEISDGSIPLGKLLDDEFRSVVISAINSLPEDSRKVFELSRNIGLKYEDIAQELGISVNTVKYHMKQSLSILRSLLEKYL